VFAWRGRFFENGVGGFGSDEGNGVLIVLGEIVVDGLLQLGGAFEGDAADAVSDDLDEEALDHVEPGGRRRREVDVEAQVFHTQGRQGREGTLLRSIRLVTGCGRGRFCKAKKIS